MKKFNDAQMEKIKTAVETSPVWEQLNAQVKRLYQQHNRIPTDEEYQTVRTMILCKVALEDKNVMKVLSDCTWEALRAGAV